MAVSSDTGGVKVMVVPLVVAEPWPAAGWVSKSTVSGLSPSGSLSLPSTLRVSGAVLVDPLSLRATGGWLTGTVTVTATVAGAETAPRLSRTW
ncbi:hypothetical protein D3C76_1364310 [compost metagenome]